MNENTVSFKLTVTEVVELVAFLTEQLDADLWRLRNIEVPEDGSDIAEYDVQSAESAMRRRYRVARFISMVTGATVEDEYGAAVVELREAYEAQLEAQRQASAEALTVVES